MTASDQLRCELHGPLNALSQSPDGQRVVVAGRDVLKVVQISDGIMTQGQNLRIMKKHLNFSSIDVHWHPLESFKNWLVTAATNGAVVLWDLNMTDMKKTARIINEHTRTVNRVQFNCNDPFLLMSGSQDGTMKMWDLRTRGQSIQTFDGRAESVRDVQFNPHNSTGFAAAFENGCVQVWDIRQPTVCEQRISGHQGPAFCISWHPEDRNVIVSGGRDKIIKVWRTGGGKPEPMASVHTIASVGRVKWRPQHRYHVASCSLVADNSVHVWDLQRPFIPLASFTDHKDLATDIEWAHDSDGLALFSCSKDKFVIYNKFSNADFPQRDVPTMAMGWSVQGQLGVVVDNCIGELPQLTAPISADTGTGYFNRSRSTGPNIPLPIPFPFRPVLSILDTNLHTSTSKISLTDAFAYQAQHYAHQGNNMSMRDMCAHNAEVAQRCGAVAAAQMWRMLSLILARLEVSKSTIIDDFFEGDEEGELQVSKSTDTSHPPRSKDVSQAVDGWKHTGQDVYRGSFGASSENSADTRVTANGARLFSTDLSDSGSGSSLDEEDGSTDTENEGERMDEYWEMDMPRDIVLADEMVDIVSPIPSPALQSIPLQLLLGAASFGSGEKELLLTGMKPAIMQSEPTVKKHSRTSSAVPTFRSLGLIKELLMFYADQVCKGCKPYIPPIGISFDNDKGVVQLCVSILEVLGEHGSRVNVDSRLREQWFFSYIELLQRMRLFSVATQMIKTSQNQSIAELNTDSTTLYMACGNCNKPLVKPGPLCERCHVSASLCSLCHQGVRGAFAWCQGCGHGGHVGHIREWFQTNKWCPTGCNHMCQF